MKSDRKSGAAKPRKPNVCPLVADGRVALVADGRTEEQHLSVIAVDGVLANAATVLAFSKRQLGKEGNILQAVESLHKCIKASKEGDLSVSDTYLIGQATALNSIFNEMMRCAALSLGTHLEATDTYMRLGLKAQSQCRATLESLAKIKNPPNVAFVKQANIAHGPQQVNINAAGVARVEEIKSPPTELLEHDDGRQWLDTGTASTAGTRDPSMATVGTIDRPAHGARKSRSKS